LGGLAMESLLGLPLIWGIVGLVIYSATFSIFGGLKAVVWTDVVQVVVLILGGAVAAYSVLAYVGDGSFMAGLTELYQKTPERFNMVFAPTDSYIDRLSGETRYAYTLLPGLSVLLGGMWIANLYYWGNNQYIIQRALAATSLREAQKGIVFAAFLKVFMPLVVVIPGIAAFVLNADIQKADQAFPCVLNNYVFVGLKGLTIAGLIAAIRSSISSIVNSASTIFTLDIYHKHINPQASETKLVNVGKISAAMSLVIGALIAPSLGNLRQVFQYIQEYTGLISPGVVAIFIFGMFWKRTTANAALAVVIAAIPLSLGFKLLFPDLPFIDRMGITFLLCALLLIVISLLEIRGRKAEVTDGALRWGLILSLLVIGAATGAKILLEDIPMVGKGTGLLTLVLSLLAVGLLWTERKGDDIKGIEIESTLFATDRSFNLGAFAVILVLLAIYAGLW